MAVAQIRLERILDDRLLGLELLTDAQGGARRIEGAHAIELVDAGQYVEPDWVVLTTGLALADDAARQRAFVRGLADAGVAAIGFGIGVMVERVPQPLLDEAVAHDVPVFQVPMETTFSTIVRRVMEEVLSSANPQVARVLGMQERLVAALDASDPERAALAMLEGMLDAAGGVVVGGEVVAAVGDPPWPELLEQLAAGHRYRAGQDVVTICLPIGADAEGSRAIALAVPRDHAASYARPVARFAAVVLQMALTGRRVAAEQERALRSALLLDLIAAPRVTSQLVERARGFGFDPVQPVRCALLQGVSDEGSRQAAVGALDRFFADRRIARLVRAHGDEIIAMWQGGYTGVGLLDALGAHHAIAGGIGPVLFLREGEVLGSAVAGARAAALRAADLHDGARLASYEELAYCDLVLAFVPPEQHRAAPSPLEVLRQDKADLVSTLVAYFEHDLDVGACARSLSLHANSLRYRLSRIEQRLGRSLRDPAVITDLYLALRAEQLHGEPPERAVTVAARHSARSRAPLS